MKKNLSLLNEVRLDAFEKTRGAEQDEKFFGLIRLMCELNRLAREEGLLTIAEANISSEITLCGEIREALNFFVETASMDDLAKKLTNQYWAKNLQGENALLYYMVILSIANTHLGKNTRELEQLLISCLNAESAERYYKKYNDR